MFEVVSALQKSIRRGKCEDAVYWGVELYISNFIPYAWKRLRIIACEDVGLAYPLAPVVIDTLKKLYDDLSRKDDKKNQNRMPYVQAILFLAKCKKSRYVDWCQSYWFDEIIMNGGKKEIPGYAIDIHTRKGKIIGKTINDFFDEGSYLENHTPFDKEEEYKEECRKRWSSKEWCSACDEAKERLQQSNKSKNSLF